MSDRSPLLYLSEMLASMEKIERYMAGVSYAEFVKQDLLVDGVERNIEKIGEAAAAVPDDIRSRHPEVENHRRAAEQGDPPLFCGRS